MGFRVLGFRVLGFRVLGFRVQGSEAWRATERLSITELRSEDGWLRVLQAQQLGDFDCGGALAAQGAEEEERANACCDEG